MTTPTPDNLIPDLVGRLRATSLALADPEGDEDESDEYRERLAQLCMLLDWSAEVIERMDRARGRLAGACAFCGARMPEADRPDAEEAIRAHVRACPAHPLRAELEAARAEVERLRAFIDEKSTGAYCTHCLKRFPGGRGGIEAFRAHIPECSRHPLAGALRNKAFAVKVALRVLRERDAARAEVERLRAERLKTADDVLAVIEGREPETWAWPLHGLRDALMAARAGTPAAPTPSTEAR